MYKLVLYHYGFQAQERDDEIKGAGNSYNYTYRMHDTRLGRFFAVDPLANKYVYYTPYQFSGNRLIDSREFEGLEPVSSYSITEGYWSDKDRCYITNVKLIEQKVDLGGQDRAKLAYLVGRSPTQFKKMVEEIKVYKNYETGYESIYIKDKQNNADSDMPVVKYPYFTKVFERTIKIEELVENRVETAIKQWANAGAEGIKMPLHNPLNHVQRYMNLTLFGEEFKKVHVDFGTTPERKDLNIISKVMFSTQKETGGRGMTNANEGYHVFLFSSASNSSKINITFSNKEDYLRFLEAAQKEIGKKTSSIPDSKDVK